jgi:transposase InsO family protein
MNVVDGVTKRAHFIATHITITAVGAARLFLREVWKHHGTPRVVVSDRGPQFVADFTRELYCLIGIKLATSTAYHPQINGQTKHVNQELEQFLRLFVNQRQDDWEELLALGEFQYNNHVHLSSLHGRLRQTPANGLRTSGTPFKVDLHQRLHVQGLRGSEIRFVKG